jgi:ketosteroid isomerase-like protein
MRLRSHVLAAAVLATVTFPAAALDSSAKSFITRLRRDNNVALAAHDLDRIGSIYTDDAVFVWSDGTSAIGKNALLQTFGEDFADPRWTSVIFTRTPTTILVNGSSDRAFESGTWIANKRGADGSLHYGGSYSAHWIKRLAGWRVCGELYVKLNCQGRACAP